MLSLFHVPSDAHRESECLFVLVRWVTDAECHKLMTTSGILAVRYFRRRMLCLANSSRCSNTGDSV